MATESPLPIDWQHPEIIKQTASVLIDRLDDWLRSSGRNTIIMRSAHAEAMEQAIVFAGQQLDAYQMARFLEDSRSWPSDVTLVLTLSKASQIRDNCIVELQRKLAPKPVQKQGPTLGAILISSRGDHWRLVDIDRSFSGDEVYVFEMINTTASPPPRSRVSRKDLLRNYPQMFSD